MGLFSGIVDTFSGGKITKDLTDQIDAQAKAPEQQQDAADLQAKYLDPNSPSYKGPSWTMATDQNGDPVLRQSQDPTLLGRQREYDLGTGEYANHATNAPGQTVDASVPNAVLDKLQTPVTNATVAPAAAPKRIAFDSPAAFNFSRPSVMSDQGRQNAAAKLPTAGWDVSAATVANAKQAFADAGKPATADTTPAPQVDRTQIDKVLGGLDQYQAQIGDLANYKQGQTVAEAQLEAAQKQSALQAGINTEASQRAAMGAANSSRSRADRSLLSRQAVGESAYIGQDAARTAALTQAQNQGNMAQLQAQESDYENRFRLDALSKASDLGLNQSALEVDLSKTNLNSATNWINQQFNQLGIDKQINQQQAQMLLGYTRDMAAIQYQYDQMSTSDQEQADSLLMQKYGIDQQTAAALKQMKEQNKMHWNQVLTGAIGGIVAGATQAGAHAAGIG